MRSTEDREAIGAQMVGDADDDEDISNVPFLYRLGALSGEQAGHPCDWPVLLQVTVVLFFFFHRQRKIHT